MNSSIVANPDAAVNPYVIKTLLANVLSTFFTNDKPAVSNGLRNTVKPPYSLLIFLAGPVNKTLLLSKYLITLIISFIVLFFIASPEPLLDVILLLSSFIPLLI